MSPKKKVENFIYKYNRNRKTERLIFWSQSAIECWLRSCQCEGCLIQQIMDEDLAMCDTKGYSYKNIECQMKKIVKETYLTIGRPTQEQIDNAMSI